MDIRIYPGKLRGTVAAPPSKSVAHRALICASLAAGRSEIRGISGSKDMEATISCMTALGARIERTGKPGCVTVFGIGTPETRETSAAREIPAVPEVSASSAGFYDGAAVGGAPEVAASETTVSEVAASKTAMSETAVPEAETSESGVSGKTALLNCIESGSTLRFLLPVAAALGADASFQGCGKLPERPMTPLADEMKKKGVLFLPEGRDSLPFSIRGRLQPGIFEIPGNVSSQYISGLLFALPLLAGDSEIRVKGKLESVGYVALTLKMMRDFGIEIAEEDGLFRVPGKQSYRPAEIAVEGDYSQAAFWLSAAACGSELTVTGLRADSAQGDREAVQILERFGAPVKRSGSAVSAGNPEGSGKLTALQVDGGDIPDVIPVLSVVAACAEGESVFRNISRLRIKECDRLSAMADCLSRLGVQTAEAEDELRVVGGSMQGGCEVDGYNDHRIVMSMAVAALSCSEPVVIRGAEAIAKSYPDFFDEFRRLGGRADVITDR